MNKTVTLVLAVVLMVIVMVISAVLFFTNAVPRERWVLQEVWKAPYGGATSAKFIDLTGDGEKDLFLQTDTGVAILDAQGQEIFSLSTPSKPASTMGDFDGDGVDDFLVAYVAKSGNTVAEAYTGQGNLLWSRDLPDLGAPVRANSVDLEGDKRREAVIGDEEGRVACLSGAGEVRWVYALPETTYSEIAYVRGLDDVSLGGGKQGVAVANYAGNYALLNADGLPLWEGEFPEYIRRLRAYDLDGDGVSEVILGGEDGLIQVLDSADGSVRWQGNFGYRVTEIADAQLDDNPSTTEFVVGGKYSSVRGYDAQARWVVDTVIKGEKVTEIAPLNIDDDKLDELLIGDADGYVTLCDNDGKWLAVIEYKGGITKLETGKLGKAGRVLVATTYGVTLTQPYLKKAPFWYNTLTAGFLVCILIAVVAWVLTTLIKPAPKLVYTAEDMSVEGLRAKRKMLLESLHDLQRLYSDGEIPGEAYEARVRELRERLAEVETRLMEKGVPFKPQVMRCPNCGAPLELGTDRCPYCGQTVI